MKRKKNLTGNFMLQWPRRKNWTITDNQTTEPHSLFLTPSIFKKRNVSNELHQYEWFNMQGFLILIHQN